MTASSATVHIIYIHGFNGNDTTFRRFPTDLQNYLNAYLPAQQTRFRTRSSMYPTYKSKKPIANATHNFLEWLYTQPPSPVILLGHSMGGLLAADAATSPSQGAPNCKHPIIGMIAFDTPYLGMHPHVVISGIASLFAKKEEQDASPANADTVVNDPNVVQFHDNRVTDHWDEFKKGMPPPSPQTPTNDTNLAQTRGNSMVDEWDEFKKGISPPRSNSQLPATPTSPRSSNASQSLSPTTSPTSPSTSLKSRASSAAPPGIQKMFGKLPSVVKDHPSVQGFLATQAQKPFGRWLTKNSEDPFGASKTWVVERLQFGSCMFDPKDLKDRYGRIVKWQWKGGWVNYWTITKGSKKEKEKGRPRRSHRDSKDDSPDSEKTHLAVDQKENDRALKETVLTPTSESTQSLKPPSTISEHGSSTSSTSGEKPPKRSSSPSSPRHFVVLPTGLGAYLGGADNWEQIDIDGAEDEVAAHLGMFMEDQNLGYDELVTSTAEKIRAWCARAGV